MAAKTRQTTTHRNTKIMGTQQYLNMTTGEIETMNVISQEERDFNFYKLWMRNFISTLDIMGNQKTKLCFWVIDHLNRDNQLTMTYRQIAQASGMSLETVRITMNRLIDADFLRRINQGCYLVNPDVIYKGTHAGRMNVLNTYTNLDAPVPTPQTTDEKIETLEITIQTLTEELEKLKTTTQTAAAADAATDPAVVHEKKGA